MAKLKISADFLVETLFDDAFVTINGCSFDPITQAVVLEVQGSAIPDAEEVIAEVTEARRSVTFTARETPKAA